MEEYRLIDSGGFEKLEKWGGFVLRRPDPQAIWEKSLPVEEWHKADAVFGNDSNQNSVKSSGVAKWKKKNNIPDSWNVVIGGFTFEIALSGFKHTGVFPEHMPNWQWIEKTIELRSKNYELSKIKILNLFGYTGGATLAGAKAGAEVVHVDASKGSVDRAKENAKLSGLENSPIRWIVDDADVFVKREISRGNFYDGIVLDPPSFGKGAKGEVWKIEEGLVPLLENCKKILNVGGFLLLNGYAEGFTPESYAQLLSSVFHKPIENIERGKLIIKESSERGFILPAGIFARFIN